MDAMPGNYMSSAAGLRDGLYLAPMNGVRNLCLDFSLILIHLHSQVSAVYVTAYPSDFAIPSQKD